jgi:predicted deacetylase
LGDTPPECQRDVIKACRHEGVSAILTVSLSGINAWTLDRAADLSNELATRDVPFSMLVAPKIAGADQPGAVLNWVRDQQRTGNALIQHGYDHPADPRNRTIRRRAEFASLPAHEAKLRLTASAATMERLDLITDAFVPPRWVASPGTMLALRHKGFAMCADLMGVRDLRTGSVHRGRVQGFGFGERTEPWWCFAVVMGAARAARRGQLVRLAVDTVDLGRSGPRQALLDAVDIALHHGASAVTYPELLGRRVFRVA